MSISWKSPLHRRIAVCICILALSIALLWTESLARRSFLQASASRDILTYCSLLTAVLMAVCAAVGGTLLLRFEKVWLELKATQRRYRQVVSSVLRDVSERRQVEQALVENQARLSHLAHHDALTGLPNRLQLQTLLPQVLERAERERHHVAFLYVDVDHFKDINDSRGHASGDLLLEIVAGRLRAAVSEADIVARMGGDEFVVVASKLPGPDVAEEIARRLMNTLSLPFEIADQMLTVTASIGVSVFPENGRDYELLLKNADIALYRAKEEGRNTFRLFTAQMHTQLNERLNLEHALRAAIRNEQFHVEYQPIIELRTGKIASLEALLRWTHPTRGPIAPSQFVDVAESTGLITDLGELTLRQVCHQIRIWQDMGVAVPVAINVSPRQLERQNMLTLIRRAAKDAGIDPSLLHFELTESALMHGHDSHVEMLKGLRALGVHVSIDDFGTGYSSLAYLRHLPIDYLKIDRAFIRDIGTPGNGDAIVTAIVRMASSLGLSTIAEGVETPEQLRRLRELGANMAQGYYFSKPLGVDVCLRLLSEAAHRERLTDTLRLRIADCLVKPAA